MDRQAHPLDAYQTSYGLMCVDHADLLSGLARSIGIDAPVRYYFGGPDASTIAEYATQSGDDGSVSFRVDRPAHDCARQNFHYRFHAVVLVDGTIYDPSYGTTYPESALEFTETDAGTGSERQAAWVFPDHTVKSTWVCDHPYAAEHEVKAERLECCCDCLEERIRTALDEWEPVATRFGRGGFAQLWRAPGAGNSAMADSVVSVSFAASPDLAAEQLRLRAHQMPIGGTRVDLGDEALLFRSQQECPPMCLMRSGEAVVQINAADERAAEHLAAEVLETLALEGSGW